MSNAGAPRHDPVPIGEVARPPFARLPDPASLFHLRAARFAALAQHHELGRYLRFMAALADAQHRSLDRLPNPAIPADDARQRAAEFGMPPLDRNQFAVDAAFEATFDHLFSLAQGLEMPEAARAGLSRARALRQREQMVEDRKSTRLNSSHLGISYAVFCLKKK